MLLNKYGRVFACCFIGSMMFGCAKQADPSQAPKSTPVATKKTSAKPLIANIDIGEGYNAATDVSTGEVCIDFESVTVTHPSEQRFKSFYIEAEDEVEYEFEQVMPNTLGPDGYAATIDEFFDDELNNQNKRLLTLFVTMPTVKREADNTSNTKNPDGPCAQGTADNFQEFVAECGTGFLQSEERGVLLILTTDVGQYTYSQRKYLEALLHLNVEYIDHKQNLDAVMSEMVIEGLDLTWQVRHLTPAGPTISTVDSSTWDTYVDDLNDDYLNSEGDITNPTFGEVIDQQIAYYADAFFETCLDYSTDECAIEDDGGCAQTYAAQYRCYRETVNHAAAHRSRTSYMEREVERIKWILDNDDYDEQGNLLPNPPGRVRYPTPPLVAWNKYNKWLNDYSICKTTAFTYSTQCDQAIANETATFCGSESSCPGFGVNTISSCDPRIQFSIARQLPEVYIVPVLSSTAPPEFYTVNRSHELEQVATNDPINGRRMCFFTGMGGEMDEDVDRVVVGTNAADTFWNLDLTHHTDSGALYGGMHCVYENSFIDGASSTVSHGFAQLTTNGDTFISLGPSKYAAVLQGAKGRFDKGGEWVRVADGAGSSDSELRVETQTGDNLTGYSMYFGVDSPVGKSPRYAARPTDPTNPITEFSINSSTADWKFWRKDTWLGPYQSKRQLIPLSEGVCFLTSTSGDYDAGSDFTRLVIEDDYWYLKVGSTCQEDSSGLTAGVTTCEKSSYIGAVAKCYAYDQTL